MGVPKRILLLIFIVFIAEGLAGMRLVNSNRGGLVLSFEAPAVLFNNMQVEGGEYLSVEMEGAGQISEVGSPKLPVFREIIEVPEGAEVRAELFPLSVREEGLKEGLKVLPVAPPVPKIEGAHPEFTMNDAVYSEDLYYPGEYVRTERLGMVRGHELYLLEVFPVQYNPVRDSLKILQKGEIRVSFSGGNLALSDRYRSLPFERFLDKFTLNHREFVGNKSVPEVPVGYLIITPDEFYSDVLPLAEWRREMGYHVSVVKLSDIGSNPTAYDIRDFIRDAYSNWPVPPTFVLLIGDVDRMPYFVGHGADSPATDLYYADMDGTDYLPDLWVGRLSVASSSQLASVVTKVLSYERNQWSQGEEWAQRAYFMASDDPSFHGLAEGTQLYCMSKARAYGMTADSLFAYYGTGTPVSTALNDGRSIAAYSGHGSPTGWAGPSFSSGSINSLTNLDKFPFVQSYACLTGQFTYSTCFTEAWLRADGKGAVAAMGSSVTSYWYEDDILQKRLFDCLFDSSLTWLMGQINGGKMGLYYHYGNTSMVMRYFEMYNLMGDPALDLFTSVPETLYASYPTAIPVGPVEFTVTVSTETGPVKDALVAVSAGDTLLASSYTDESGAVVLNFDATGFDSVRVRITAHNKRLYEDAVTVITEGAYIYPMEFEVDDDSSGLSAGNGDGRINPFERVELGVLLKNLGVESATGVMGYLSSEDVTLLDSVESFGDFEAGDSLLVPGAFLFETGSLCDGQSVGFTLLLVSSEGDTWVSHPLFRAYAPHLIFHDVTVNDSGGNGILDPGERAELQVFIRNSGQMTAESVTAVLRTSDTLLTVLDSLSYYGTLFPDSIASGDAFEVRADPSTPYHHIALLELEIHSGQLYFADTFELMIARGGQFLVWDPDGNRNSGPVIKSLLDSLGYRGDYTTNLLEYVDELPYYQSLFVCLGIYPDNHKVESGSEEADAIVNYIENGGRVYLEGGDAWYYDPQNGGYNFGPLFGITGQSDGSSDLQTIQGEPGTFTDGMNFTYSGDNRWIDRLNPVGNGFPIFVNSSPSYICGIANVDTADSAPYKTVGTSFEIGGLSDAVFPSTKSDLLAAIMDFFGIDVKVEEGIGTEGRPLTLELPSPNPFRENVSISFALPGEMPLSLRIYDVTGRCVRTLFRGRAGAGVHVLRWDGRDDRGKKVSSGVYFIDLRAPSRDLRQKVIHLE